MHGIGISPVGIEGIFSFNLLSLRHTTNVKVATYQPTEKDIVGSSSLHAVIKKARRSLYSNHRGIEPQNSFYHWQLSA